MSALERDALHIQHVQRDSRRQRRREGGQDDESKLPVHVDVSPWFHHTSCAGQRRAGEGSSGGPSPFSEEEIAADRRKVIEQGGLYIIGTERHESRRIDNQLRGRAGRQGDPGHSKFFLSLQDDLMRIFPVESLALFFLVGVLVVAARFGLWPSIYASLLSFLVYNFFLTQPYYTFHVADQDVILTLLLFLAVAIVTGNLAARLRAQARAQRAIAKRTAKHYRN